MNKREKKVRSEISGILSELSSAEQERYARDLEAFVYTEIKRIRDKRMEALLKEKNQQVYSVRVY